MARMLDVYLHSTLVGHLIQDAGGQMVFDYDGSWLQQPGATPLSHSLPLRAKRFKQRECRGFFAGVLPEEGQREIVARNLGVSARNDYALLEWLGGECAGAVTFVPAGNPQPERDGDYRTLSAKELAALLRELPRRPLLAGSEGIRLSLAGAQDKIAVRVDGDTISLPMGGAPSTHILKPAVERFAGLVHNEAFCLRLAAAVDLPAARSEIRSVDGIEYLLVERYDRTHRTDANDVSLPERLHQEDFCQALGIVPEMKYQKEGGPSLKQCFALLREASGAPVLDLAHLLDAVIFNFLIGNNDAHAKNFSLIYRAAGTAQQETRLAPLYDLVSTCYYPELTRDIAMRIGKEYACGCVTKKDFEQLAEDAGLAKPLVRRRIPELVEVVLANLENVKSDHAVAKELATQIRVRCTDFVSSD